MYSNKKFTTKAFFVLLLLAVSATVKLYSQTYTKIDTSIICTAGGNPQFSSWADINNDGLEDLIVVNGNIEAAGSYNNYLFVNNGEWNFSQITDDPVVTRTTEWGSASAVWGDYDNDGFVDLFIDYMSFENNQLYRNNGDESFSNISTGGIDHDGADSGPSNWIDLDNDGYLDLFVTNKRMQKNLVYQNNGDGTFTRFTEGLLANYFVHLDCGPAWSDYDNDGDLDGFGTSYYIPKRYLFENEGSGNFVLNETSGLTIDEEATWGWFPPAWGDYNNDGWQDVFIATWGKNWGSDYDLLYRNNGDGTFSRVTGVAPVESRNTHEGGWWGDLDNDGYLDLIVSTFYGTSANKLYMNNGDGSFTAVSNIDFVKDRGGFVNIIDINRDGFLDLFVGRGYEGSRNNLLYANEGNSNAWLTVKPVGMVSNKSGIGTKIRLKANIGGVDMWQIRETGLTANGLNAHFGLGDATQIDSLIIQWPYGIYTVLEHIDVNQHLVITEQIPSGYLKASFAVDTTFGREELEVHFKDISRYDPGKPVTSWSWDFNGDGTEDSNEQDPVYTYSNPDGALYSVSLKVSNGADSAEIVKENIIRIQKEKPGMEDNLAQWSLAATASSIYAGYWTPESAVDDEINSHWSSIVSKNDQWLKVELDTVYEVGKVIVDWESPFAESYEIQTSPDGENWDTVACNCEGDGENDTLLFTGTQARYLKLVILNWGKTKRYTITEFKIYQSDGNEYESDCDFCRAKNPTGITNAILTRVVPVSVYPNPMNRNVTFSFDLHENSKVQVKLYDLTGRKITDIFQGNLPAGEQSVTWDRKELKGGIYYYKINSTAGDRSRNITGKLVIME
jgi:PKD repeat protein